MIDEVKMRLKKSARSSKRKNDKAIASDSTVQQTKMFNDEVLLKASKIRSLNDSSDWSIWNRNLKDILNITDLWKILIDETPELIDLAARFAWHEKQKQLEDLWFDTIFWQMPEEFALKKLEMNMKKIQLLLEVFFYLIISPPPPPPQKKLSMNTLHRWNGDMRSSRQ